MNASPALAALQDYTMTNAGVASHYDDLDAFYREIWGEHVHHGVWHTGRESDLEAAENLVKIVAELARISPGDNVCDIGFGYGATARILAERHGASVTGMTISEVQFRYAQQNNAVPGRTAFLLRDWYENQLPASQFDAVISIESLEHMTDLPRFFSEACRVLKPGGRLVCCAWMSCEQPGALARHFLIDATTREAHLAGIRPASEFQAATEGAGFSRFQFADLAKKVKRTWPLCAWRTIKGLATKPHYRKFIFSSKNPNRVFALTLFRIWIAYELGVQRYGVFSAEKRP
jgi:tocopherol O-methyltransferase